MLVATIMERYLYKRWFRPYRSDISAGEFICQFIIPRDIDREEVPPCEADITSLLPLHRTICGKAKRLADRAELSLPDIARTTLETAVDFITAMEAREQMASNSATPCQYLSASSSEVRGVDDKVRQELTTLPSSQWVSDERANEWGWTGLGQREEERLGPLWEKKAFSRYRTYLHCKEVVRDALERREQPELTEIGWLNGKIWTPPSKTCTKETETIP